MRYIGTVIVRRNPFVLASDAYYIHRSTVMRPNCLTNFDGAFARSMGFRFVTFTLLHPAGYLKKILFNFLFFMLLIIHYLKLLSTTFFYQFQKLLSLFHSSVWQPFLCRCRLMGNVELDYQTSLSSCQALLNFSFVSYITIRSWGKDSNLQCI